MQTAWMDEDTEVTPTSSVSARLKMPLPAPLDSVPGIELDSDTLDDLDIVTIPRGIPATASGRGPVAAALPPVGVPAWALLAGGTLLFAAIATTVALVL